MSDKQTNKVDLTDKDVTTTNVYWVDGKHVCAESIDEAVRMWKAWYFARTDEPTCVKLVAADAIVKKEKTE